MALPVPTVRGDLLTWFDSDGNVHTVRFGTPEWERWMEIHKAFRYDDVQGGFSAHKYPRHGYFYLRRSTGRRVKLQKPSGDPDLEFIEKRTWYYWYAFRNIRIGEDIFPFKAYIGALPDPERMQKASTRLTEKISDWARERGITIIVGKKYRLFTIVYPT